MKTVLGVLLVATALGAAPCPAAAQQAYSFYGLQMGMTRDAVAQRFKGFDGASVRDPGHGIDALELQFDRENLLFEIRATYLRPSDPLELIGVQRALREKFVAPITTAHPDIAVTLDEYGNRAAMTLVLLSTGIREKNIEFHKREFLKRLQ